MDEQARHSSENASDDPALEAARARGHEDEGLYVGRIVATAVSLLALALASLGIIAIIMRSKSNPDASAVAAAEEWRRQRVDPGVTPNQTDVRQSADIQMQRQLDNYEWQNADHTVARIPIQRAMKLLAEKQLQVSFTSSSAVEDVDDAARPDPEAKR